MTLTAPSFELGGSSLLKDGSREPTSYFASHEAIPFGSARCRMYFLSASVSCNTIAGRRSGETPKYFIAASFSALSPNTNLYFVSSNAATSLIADLIPSRSVAFLKLVKAITFGARNSNTRRRMFLFSGVLSSSATRGRLLASTKRFRFSTVKSMSNRTIRSSKLRYIRTISSSPGKSSSGRRDASVTSPNLISARRAAVS
mmetsp:Transcript_1951/g.7344  ORF Transcript_1951/g.7344 Transcript_1951/m.7344 type:complete len:201 (-) Transcript_1951:475-1077(-)